MAMASKFMQWFMDPNKNFLAKMHHKALSNRLRKYGLRYDDLYDPMYDPDIKEALNRLPRPVVDARNQRLKRAMDLSMKHLYLPDDMQAMQTPFRTYLQDMLMLWYTVLFISPRLSDLPLNSYSLIERAEREALGALPLYQRPIP